VAKLTLAGPFPVTCNHDDFDNEIKVVPTSATQFKHSIWVTKTPDPPVGRREQVVGLVTRTMM